MNIEIREVTGQERDTLPLLERSFLVERRLRLTMNVGALGSSTLRVPLNLPRVTQLPKMTQGWHEIAKDSIPLISLHLVTRS